MTCRFGFAQCQVGCTVLPGTPPSELHERSASSPQARPHGTRLCGVGRRSGSPCGRHHRNRRPAPCSAMPPRGPYEVVAADLRAQIASGQPDPGELPTVADLALRMMVQSGQLIERSRSSRRSNCGCTNSASPSTSPSSSDRNATSTCPCSSTPTAPAETAPNAPRASRWKAYRHDDLVARDKANLDITWLKDPSLTVADDRVPPEIIARESWRTSTPRCWSSTPSPLHSKVEQQSEPRARCGTARPTDRQTRRMATTRSARVAP